MSASHTGRSWQVLGASGTVRVEGVPATITRGVAGATNVELQIGEAATYPITIRLD